MIFSESGSQWGGSIYTSEQSRAQVQDCHNFIDSATCHEVYHIAHPRKDHSFHAVNYETSISYHFLV